METKRREGLQRNREGQRGLKIYYGDKEKGRFIEKQRTEEILWRQEKGRFIEKQRRLEKTENYYGDKEKVFIEIEKVKEVDGERKVKKD